MARVNIKIDEAVHEQHNERRKELGLSWTEYMKRVEYEPERQGVNIDYAEIESRCKQAVESVVR